MSHTIAISWFIVLLVHGLLPRFSFLVIDSVWLSLNGTTYQNNSLVTLEDIGESDNTLFCITNQTACCRPPKTGENVFSVKNWFFPNNTRVPSRNVNGTQWNFYRERGQYVCIAEDVEWMESTTVRYLTH